MTTNKFNEFITDILFDPKPIVCLDTCVYLDFLNNALEISFPKNLSKLEEIIKKDQVHLIVPDVILDEFSRNLETVLNRLKDIIAKNISSIQAIQELLILFNKIDKTDSLPPHLVNSELCLQVIDVLQHRIKDILSNGRIINLTEEMNQSAIMRLRKCVRPAQRGKDSHGDCLIVQAMLSVAKNLREHSFNRKIIFVTSNVDDFGGETTATRRNLHPDIDKDFSPLQISFYTHINHAIAKLLVS